MSGFARLFWAFAAHVCLTAANAIVGLVWRLKVAADYCNARARP